MENKFTWLVHLHLGNEERLMDEIMALVASEPNNDAAGRLVEMWVKVALSDWLSGFPGRNRQHDGEMRLLAWDLLGSALAYAEWVRLVEMVIGEAQTSDNLFTLTLFRNIRNSSQLQQHVRPVVNEASSLYAAADALKDWFEIEVDAWISSPGIRQQQNVPISVLVSGLIQNTYALIHWAHVARAFRDGD
jgi:hypothetical protein